MKNKTLELVKSIKSDLSAYRKQFEKNRDEEEKAYYGDIWSNTSQNRPFENEIFQIIEGEVPILTDELPSVAVLAKNPALENQTKVLSRAVQWVFKDQDLELDYPSVVRDSLVCGDGWIHQYYDANEENGNGKIVNEILHWKQVYLSGISRKIDQCPKARIELERTRDWLKLNYQNFSEELESVKCDMDGASYMDKEGRETYDVGNIGPKKNTRPKKYKDDDTLLLVKTYIKDYSITPISEDETNEDLVKESKSLESGEMPDINKYEDHNAHIEAHNMALVGLYESLGLTPDAGLDAATQLAEQLSAENPEGGFETVLMRIAMLEDHISMHEELLKENPKSGKLKYKNGWRVIETVGNIVLKDGEMDEDHGEIPLVPFYCYLGNSIFGFSEVRNILSSQRMSAVMAFKEYKGLQKVANPEKIIDVESGLTAEDITNEDGAIYELPQGTNIRNIAPGQISPQLAQFRDERSRKMQGISGVNEVTQGQVVQPNASGVTVTKTQNQAIGRIRLKDRQNQYYSMRRLGRITASNILQYWQTEKVVAFEGGEEILFNPIEMQDLEYNVEIAPGTMAGVDKDSYNALLAQFLQAGHITFDEFLKVAHIPKSQKLLEMVEERAGKDQQIKQLQQELILLKGSTSPESLTPEEMEIFEQLSQQAGTQ